MFIDCKLNNLTLLAEQKLVGRFIQCKFKNCDMSYSIFDFGEFQECNFKNADLRNTSIHNANFTDCNFKKANFRQIRGATVSNGIGSIILPKWEVIYTINKIFIGCQTHTIDEWRNFTDSQINEMDSEALQWWSKYKDIIMTIIDANLPAMKAQSNRDNNQF